MGILRGCSPGICDGNTIKSQSTIHQAVFNIDVSGQWTF